MVFGESILNVLETFTNQPRNVSDLNNEKFITEMWDETNSQKEKTLLRNVSFPEDPIGLILSGPHIGVSNPFYKSSRRICKIHSDFDPIDLTAIGEHYIQRCNYSICCSIDEYKKRMQSTPWGVKISDEYRIVARKMLSQTGEMAKSPG